MRTKLLFIYSLITVILFSCSNSEETENLVAVGGKQYGGEIKFMSSEKVSSLFPIESIDIFNERILSQMFEPLFQIDLNTLKVTPGIAESFKINKNATVYTLKIRKGVKFHSDDCFSSDGREVTAEDVKFTLDLACSGLPNNQISYLLINYIKGAKDFNKKSKNSLPENGVSGIKVIDPYTIKIELSQAFTSLDKVLTHTGLSIIAKEAYEKYGTDVKNHPVGTGPFMLEELTAEKVILKRNPNYWKKDNFGNQLPFLDKISITYSKNKKRKLHIWWSFLLYCNF